MYDFFFLLSLIVLCFSYCFLRHIGASIIYFFLALSSIIVEILYIKKLTLSHFN